jgi:nucleoid-associated protein YgaU
MIAKFFIAVFAGTLIFFAGCAKKTTEEAPSPAVVAPPAPPVEDTTVVEVPEPEPEVIQTEVPNTAIIIPENESGDLEQAGIPQPDSAAYVYMIKPNDYLSKIAYNEYGNPNEWRLIYNWNKESIGDNPNLIYPYNELELFKPEDVVTVSGKVFTEHVVRSGENLWSIAVNEYGDGKAWSVLFWDNEETLSSNAGLLEPGMRLRVRTELWQQD